MVMTRKWTPEEDKKLVELWKSNYNIKAICTIINRSKNAIWKRIELLREKSAMNKERLLEIGMIIN